MVSAQLQFLFGQFTEGVEVEGAGHQWAEPDPEGVGEEGLYHTRSTYCNSSAVVGS